MVTHGAGRARDRGRRAVAGLLVVAGLGTATAAVVAGRDDARPPVTSPPGSPAPSARPGGTGPELPAPEPATVREGGRGPGHRVPAPTGLEIASLGVDAPVVPVGVQDGVLVPPADPQVLGWWSDGARPGDGRGSALVTGHTVHTGGGALDDLETLRPGAQVRVVTRGGPVAYAVSSVRTYRKAGLAEASARLFRQDGPGRLVLVTCEDWDGVRYLSNVVVTAVPADR